MPSLQELIQASDWNPWDYVSPDTYVTGIPSWAQEYLTYSLGQTPTSRGGGGPEKYTANPESPANSSEASMAWFNFGLPQQNQFSYTAGNQLVFPTNMPTASYYFDQMGAQIPSQYKGEGWYAKIDTTKPNWWSDPGAISYEYNPQTADTWGDLLEAIAIVGGGALGISGLAGLGGFPGIDSLLSGASNLFGGSGASGGSAISGSALAEELAALGIGNTGSTGLIGALGSGGAFGPPVDLASQAAQIANAWTQAGVPMSAQEAAAYLAEGGTGFGATEGGGLLGQLSGLSNNPVQALQQTLQSQVDQGLLTPAQMQQAMQSVATTGSTGSNWLDTIFGNSGGSGLLSGGTGSLLSGGLQALGGYLSGQSATSAAQTQADAILRAAKIAADAAKFKPVGVTTRFGASNFGYDAKGNLTTAGYQLAPDVQAQQTQLMGASGNALQQYLAAQGATAPMGQTAQTLFGLGQGYLGTTPQEQAAQYMAEQQALLAPYRERDFASLENRLLNQGRLGLATGATSTGLGAANPELEAFYNAQRMQDLKLAAEATQGGMDYAKFGAGLVGTGGDMLNSMYGTQVNAYNPYKTAIGGASMLEGLGQNAMDLGINIGAKGTAANAQSGMLLSQGMTNAANVMAPANAYSPWGNLLSGAGTMLQNYNQQQPQQQQQAGQFMYNPYTGQPVNWN